MGLCFVSSHETDLTYIRRLRHGFHTKNVDFVEMVYEPRLDSLRKVDLFVKEHSETRTVSEAFGRVCSGTALSAGHRGLVVREASTATSETSELFRPHES